MRIVTLILFLAFAAWSANAAYPPEAVTAYMQDPAHRVVELDDATFTDTVLDAADAAQRDWIVFFYAPWCGHCKAMKPIFREAADLATRVALEDSERLYKSTEPKRYAASFAMVDAVANAALAKAFGVRSYPTFFHFAAGQAFRYNGGRDKESFAFLAQFAGLARHHSSLVPTVATEKTIAELQSLASTRVLFLLSAECTLAGEKSGSPALREHIRHLATSHMGNNRVHFAVLPKPHGDFFGENSNIRKAFDAASVGPNGERLVALTDLYEDGGAIPFDGSWELRPEKEIQRSIKGGATGDHSATVTDLWERAVPRYAVAAAKFVREHGTLPIGDSDTGSLQASLEKDDGNGFLGLIMAGDDAAMQKLRAHLRPLAQQRNREMAPAKQTSALSEGDLVSDDDVDVAAAALDQGGQRQSSSADQPFLTRRKVISLHAVVATDAFARDFGVTAAELPVFTVYWPKHQMSCTVRLDASDNSLHTTDEAVSGALRAADAGDFSGCTARDWPALITHWLLTRPLPFLDGPVRGYGLGNLELVMVGGCALLVMVLIPFAIFRAPAEDEAFRRERERRMRRPPTNAAGAAAAAALGRR